MYLSPGAFRFPLTLSAFLFIVRIDELPGKSGDQQRGGMDMRSKLTEKQYDWRKIVILLLLPVLCCVLTAFDRYIPELSYTARDVIEAIIQEDWETPGRVFRASKKNLYRRQ